MNTRTSLKVVLISMPDIVPVLPIPINEGSVYMPNLGIASVGGNIDAEHDVYLIDLVCKRRSIRRYLTQVFRKIQPDLVGLSCMTWQYDTCLKIARLIKTLMPKIKIVLGGYHATLMSEEIAASEDAQCFDFIIRGEGEVACKRLVNGLAGTDDLASIPSLSYKSEEGFVHNPRADNLDLTSLKLPIRDTRRLTNAYRLTRFKLEVIETSRGCTRSCTFCSMQHMYGRRFRAFPIARVLEDLDVIYFKRKARWVFIADDNIVLDRARLIQLCDAIIARSYTGLKFIVQADCVSMAEHEEMVAKMAEAGIRCVFLGIENGSRQNLSLTGKGDIVSASRKAVEHCHKYGIIVLGLMINGFPDDNEDSIRKNYAFAESLQCDFLYSQLLNPYPKTAIRRTLLDLALLDSPTDYTRYSGLWATIRTKYLDREQLQYQAWYQRQLVMKDWKPSPRIRAVENRLLMFMLSVFFKPLVKRRRQWLFHKYGWEGLYQRAVERWERLNRFEELEEFGP